MKENIIAFVGAVILTMVVVVVINNNSGVFKADVLQGSSSITAKDADGNDIVVTISDMELKMEWDNIALVANRDFSSVSMLNLELLFDKENITIDRNSIDSRYDMSFTKKDSGNGCDIFFQKIGDIKKWDIIFKLKNTNEDDIQIINVWQVKLTGLEGSTMSVSVSK